MKDKSWFHLTILRQSLTKLTKQIRAKLHTMAKSKFYKKNKLGWKKETEQARSMCAKLSSLVFM